MGKRPPKREIFARQLTRIDRFTDVRAGHDRVGLGWNVRVDRAGRKTDIRGRFFLRVAFGFLIGTFADTASGGYDDPFGLR